jgi:hypothetical protein
MPAAVFIKPENSILLRDHNLFYFTCHVLDLIFG